MPARVPLRSMAAAARSAVEWRWHKPPRNPSPGLYDVRTMPEQKPRQIKGHCPNCGPDRYGNVVGYYEVTGHDEHHDIWGTTTCYILECGGCKTTFFREDSTCSEDWGPDGIETRTTYYPSPAKRDRPNWFSWLNLDDGLYRLLDETYNALDVDARVLSAIGARTIFDRAAELLHIDPALTFKQKLDRLQSTGHISPSERNQLDILTDAGGAAAHRGWKPTAAQLGTIMSILESFVHRKFVLDPEADKLKTEIPARPKKRATKRP
jgi:hypothetical protein